MLLMEIKNSKIIKLEDKLILCSRKKYKIKIFYNICYVILKEYRIKIAPIKLSSLKKLKS
jgi:hypothetical protein